MNILHGQGVSKGIQRGTIYFYSRRQAVVEPRQTGDVAGERERLAQARERCGAKLLEQGQSLPLPDWDRLYLHPIAYTEFQNRRVVVHNQDSSRREIAMSQGDFAALLLAFPYFCDCMKGMLVNLEAVDKLLEDRFLLKDGGTVPISRLKYRQVRERFLAYTYARVRGDT